MPDRPVRRLSDLSRDFAWTEAVARRFHEEYERLAPMYDYATRPDSAVPWDDVPMENRLLMMQTVAEVFVAERIGEMGHGLHCDSKVGLPCDCTLREQVVFRLTAGTPPSGREVQP